METSGSCRPVAPFPQLPEVRAVAKRVSQWRGVTMIQGWPDLALGLDTPAVAICQTPSVSADLELVLPSYPRLPPISQPIFARSACHPPPEGAYSPAPTGSFEVPCCPVPGL